MQTIFTRISSPYQLWVYVGLLGVLVFYLPASYAVEPFNFSSTSSGAEQKLAKPAVADKPTLPVAGADNKATTAVPKSESETKTESQLSAENNSDEGKGIGKILESLRKEATTSKKGSVNPTALLEPLDALNTELNTIETKLGGIEGNISSHNSNLTDLKKELQALDQKISTNSSTINSQKYLIENYAAGGYEILLRMEDLDAKLDKLGQGQSLQNNQKQEQRISMIKDLDHVWRLLVIVLASFTPMAFAFASNREHYKPLLDGIPQHQGLLLVCLGVFLVILL